MTTRPAWAGAVDAVAMLLAFAGAALLLLGDRATGVALGAGALTVLAVGSWARARHAEGQAARLAQAEERAGALVAERDALRAKLETLEPLATTGLASAGLAHELKNALMVTQGFAQLARKAGEDAGAAPKLLAHLETVEQQADALAGRLKSFVRLAAPDPERTTRPLAEVVSEVVSLVGPLARQKELAFEHDVAQGLTREVTDPDVRGALLDLLLNALDHATGAVRLVVTDAQGQVSIVVEDDGPGVPPEMRERLFEPFATGRAGGLGLGLHRARVAIERDGGVLAFEDRQSGGARFVVTLGGEP